MEDHSSYVLNITWSCRQLSRPAGPAHLVEGVVADRPEEGAGDDEPPESGGSPNDDSEHQPLFQLLRKAVSAALARHEVPEAHIGLALVDDERIAEINLQHLGHDGATDVITFDMRDEPDAAGIEGEIVMSVETAAREGLARGHGLEAELALYAVHGTLHLIGYDDEESAAAERMHNMEDEILTDIGLGAIYGGGAP